MTSLKGPKPWRRRVRYAGEFIVRFLIFMFQSPREILYRLRIGIILGRATGARSKGSYETAIKHFDRIFEISEAQPNLPHPALSQIMKWSSECHRCVGNEERASDLLRRAREIEQRTDVRWRS